MTEKDDVGDPNRGKGCDDLDEHDGADHHE
jgi:hypothetical protein